MRKIFIDTNILKGLYLYSDETINEIINALKAMEADSTEIIIPSIVYEEFVRSHEQFKLRYEEKYPISLFRKNFSKQRVLIENRLENIRPIKLSNLLCTKLDVEIDKYILDTKLYLNDIDEKLSLLEQEQSNQSKNYDCLVDFIETHRLEFLTLNHKNRFSALGEFREQQNLKPGLNLDIKQESFPYQKFSDVFVWYEILNNVDSNDEVIFIENNCNWWESENKRTIAKELQIEFTEMYSDASIKMMTFNDFYLEFLESEMHDKIAKLEVNEIKNNLESQIYNTRILNSLKEKLTEQIANKEIENYLIGKSLRNSKILQVTKIEVESIAIDKQTFNPKINFSNNTLEGNCKASMLVKCIPIFESNNKTLPTSKETRINLYVDVNYVCELLIYNATVNALLVEEEHEINDYSLNTSYDDLPKQNEIFMPPALAKQRYTNEDNEKEHKLPSYLFNIPKD